jgi:hypothetical protein
MGAKCDDHNHILKQVAAFNHLFDSESVGPTTLHSIGNMPFTLARYLQNQINVTSVLNDISPVEYKYETEFMYVALSVCFAKALKLGSDSQTGKTRLTTKTGNLSEDVDASEVLLDDPNLPTWLKILHERAQKDEAIIKNFISTQMELHENSSFQIKALGYIMISSDCSSTLPAEIVAAIEGELLLGDKILKLFAAETKARENYDQNCKKQTASSAKHPEGMSVTGVLVPEGAPVIPIGVIVDDGQRFGTPFDTISTFSVLPDF